MAKQNAKNSPGTNPNLRSRDGGINPSAPATGTAGWGETTDERRAVRTNDPEGTRAGQMQGNPGDDMTAASQRESKRATTNKRPSEGDDQADLSRRTSASAYSMNTSQGGTNGTFRCADMGNSDCGWETSGETDDEIVQRVEEHCWTAHGLSDWSEAMRSKVRNAIGQRDAA